MNRLLTFVFVLLAPAAMAEGIVIDDPFARVARPGAPTGAIFMAIRNESAAPDRLVGVASDVAKRVELHTHVENDGVMSMVPLEGGLKIAADSAHLLQRGGDHVMLMGLTEKLEDGMTVEITLTFEVAGDVTLMVPVDSQRGQPGHKVSHGSAHGADNGN